MHLPALVEIGSHGISLTKRPPSEKAIAPSRTSHIPLFSFFTGLLSDGSTTSFYHDTGIREMHTGSKMIKAIPVLYNISETDRQNGSSIQTDSDRGKGDER